MRMLVVHNFHRQFGGDDAIVSRYVHMLGKRGHKVFLYQRHNNEVLHFGLLRKARFPLDVLFSIRTWRDVKHLIKRERPDFLFVHGIYPLVSPSIYDVAWANHVPVVQMVHDMRFWCPSAWFFRSGKICTLCSRGNFLHGIIFRCYRRSFLLSATYAASLTLCRLRGVFAKIRLFIIPSAHIETYLIRSGVSPDRIALHPHIIAPPGRLPPFNVPAEKYACYLGRLSSEKGLLTLLEAARALSHVRFKIAGDGPLRDTLRQYVATHRLQNVEFCGFLTGEEKDRFLSDAAFLIAPSECYESFGQVAIEAYAAGTPVVAADHGGLAALVQPRETGWLFSPGNTNDLINAVKKAWEHPDLEVMAARARQRYEDSFAEDSLMSQLEESLVEVVQS